MIIYMPMFWIDPLDAWNPFSSLREQKKAAHTLMELILEPILNTAKNIL
jgi:hypothetical protein